MKPQLIYLMLFFGILLSPRLRAQNDTFFVYDFTSDVLPSGWSVTDVAGNMTSWRWSNGTASAGQYWNNRPAIASATPGGAYMFDSDGQHPPAPYPDHSILTTDTIDCSSHDEVWLQFHQYYRNAMSVTKVGVSNDDGASWTDWVINSEIGFGVETPNDALVNLDISAYAANFANVRIRFTFEGANYYWIIDDIRLIEPDPNLPDFPRTFPPELGDSLTAWGIPYHIDSLGGAYPPTELVVKWVDGTTEAEKQELRDELNVVQYDTCSCSEVELFTFANTVSLADSLNIIENGDFSDGNSGFTSTLALDCSCVNTSYCISTMFSDKCSSFINNFGEYTNPGTGQFMIIDGPATSSADIWCQSLSLDANKDYIFAFRARAGAASNFPDLRLYIDNSVVPLQAKTIDSFGKWTTYSFNFTYLGADGVANVCLKQENTGTIGYDYGLDDLFMATLDNLMFTYQDSIEEKKEKADAMPGKIEESDFNYYNFDIEELQDTTPVSNANFAQFEIPEAGGDDDLLIAILDTGVDYNYDHPTPINNFDIRPYLWRDLDYTTCYNGDYQGWNFVNRNDLSKRDRPFDDHGHGSHVAGIVVQEWEQFRANSEIDGCCKLKILPVKTHDFHGLGKLFDVSCGIIYATEMGADVINASWGFTAVQDPNRGILHFVIDTAAYGTRSVMVITSAGNSKVNINDPMDSPTTPNYPSNYNLDNILTVAAMDQAESLWIHSNFSPTKVHFAAPGENIFSIIPPGTNVADPALVWAPKSGTSMAAPVVTAYAGALKCMNNINDVNGLKITLNNLAVPINPSWLNWTITGKKMDLPNFLGGLDFTNCIVGTETPLSPNAEWQIYPNPAADDLWLSITNNQVPIRSITLTNALGQMVWQEAPAYNQGELELKISLQDLPSGLYYLSIYTERGVQGFPVVKQK